MRRLLTTLVLIFFTLAAQAGVRTQDVRYQIEDEEFTGYLAYDDALDGKRPGVLVVHEWWGLSDHEKRRARMLAELGYVAFAVDMYGSGKHTDDPDQAKTWYDMVTTDIEWWRERAMKGIEILRGHADVDATDIAAIGYCFGGGTVLQLAYGGADVDGVVSFHGVLPAADDQALVKIRTKLLVLHASRDPFVPADMVARFQQKLDMGDVDWQLVTYGGVRHSFTVPDADKRGMEALRYDADADRRSWHAMRQFFEEIFAD